MARRSCRLPQGHIDTLQHLAAIARGFALADTRTIVFSKTYRRALREVIEDAQYLLRHLQEATPCQPPSKKTSSSCSSE